MYSFCQQLPSSLGILAGRALRGALLQLGQPQLLRQHGSLTAQSEVQQKVQGSLRC